MKLTFILLALLCLQSAAKGQITGHVVSESGEPLTGVSVLIKGSQLGTTTDANGNFRIAATSNAILVFSAVGYSTIEVNVAGQSSINVTLKQGTKIMDQVVVVGFGTQRKIDVTGSISSVKGADLSKLSSQNAISSLQGKVAGVQIINNGQPGASPSVRVRGVGSISNTDPMYIVDGVIVNDLSFLNPNDIESVDILKDASSLSIYGVRAANGVFLVTTKKGHIGKPQFSYNGFGGAQIVTNKLLMASAAKYAFLINEKLGVPTIGAYPSVDWYDQILRSVAITQNHQVAVTGGTKKLGYNASAGYYNQQGLVEKNVYSKMTARIQADYKATKNLRFGIQAIYYHYKSTDIPGDIFYQAFVAPPIMAVRKSNGYYGDPADYQVGNFANPQASLDWFNQKSKGHSITASAYGEYKFKNHFTFRSSFGITDGNNQFRNYRRKDSLTTVQHSSVSLLGRDTSETRKWVWDNTLTYERTFQKHRIKALIGYSSSEDKFISNSWSVNGVPDNGESSYKLSNGDPSSLRHNLSGNRATFLSYFARVNYGYNDKYLLTATIRRDGSSKFPSENRFDNFPSFGAGWIITKEGFMKNQHLFDNLKLKGSWGKLGNANIPTNISVATVDSGGLYNYVFGGNGVVWHGANNTRFPPHTLVWEVVKETDLGIEMVLLNNRLFIEADYYIRKTENAIFSLPILGTVGASNSSILGNFASYENKGLEFSINWKNNEGRLKYNLGLNISTNKNKVTAIEGGDVDLYGGGLPVGGYLTTVARIGQPIGSFYGYVVDGVFQSNAEASASAQPNAQAGWFKYRDQNNDHVIDSKDKVIIGNPNPKLNFGFNSSFNYKQFDLELDIQGVSGVDVYNAMKGVRYGNENYTEDFYQHRWHGAGTSNSYPSADLSGPNLDPNTWFVENGDYVRIRNAQLGYTFSKPHLLRTKLKSVRVYINAQNPITIFGYKGFTPEIGGAPMSTGIDLNVYPLSATYNIGLNVNF